ncbi:TetR/AcrR family transcriptional regulator [Nocardioides luteus]|uniref:TetR family transcriptional regulator n=1 Tax=Nocardioides luteus TaxID=1844 RepID=A0A1J4NBK4_9ACTN|nr:TetR/AcrR family transcriptional regulator [Nocardioides luteus]OIJ28016.1 TetR family transcriptional regulator [Nocardioides luteus]
MSASKPLPKTKAAKDAEPARSGVRRSLVEQEIYDHATRLFAERGFAGTSFQDIADAVGLTRPALYHYVSSKDELLAKLVAEITQDSATGIQAIAARDDIDATRKVHEIVAMSVRRQAESAARFQLLIRSEADLPDGIAATHTSGRRAVLKAMAGVIEDGVAQGAFRPVDPRVAALGLLGMNNWVAWWYQPDERNDLDHICEQLADMAVASLRNPDGDAASRAEPRDVLRLIRRDLDHLEDLLDG